MQMAFGLVSLLVTLAIVLYLMVGTGYMGAVASQNKQARQTLNVMGGKDETGQIKAIDSIHTRIDRAGGRPKFIAAEVMKDGPMEKHYGIRPGDRIVEIGGLDFDANIGSREAGDEWLATAYARGQPIVVVRGVEKLTLPTPEHVTLMAKQARDAAVADAAANNLPPPAATPAAPTDAGGLTSLQSALDTIRSTPGK